jgi:tetrahydromethanopterin S-methyltransferase subunit F
LHRGLTWGIVIGFVGATVFLGTLAVLYVWLTGQAG